MKPWRIIVCAFLLADATLALGTGDYEQKQFDTFPKLRHEVLEVISGATERVWISTDYLTDGEIVSALFLALYRKLDVQVLLGRQKANGYMSRLNYLKNQKVPVFLKPHNYKTKHLTGVLADNRLMYTNANLNFMAKYKQFTATFPDPDEVVRFTNDFVKAAGLQIKAYARPVPLVGRPRYQNSKRSTVSRAQLPRTVPSYQRSDQSTGAYTYDKADRNRPAYMPSKLPKDTKWEKKMQDEAQRNSGGSNP